jgi:glycosyltransferase involved in cell wall biosynthesis
MKEIPNLVSTIIPVRNRPELLREAVDSVLQQKGASFEIVIVDDASDDATPDVASELAERFPGIIRVLRHDRCLGPGVARQFALEQAQGEFIQYLDSDDLLLPGKFQVQVAALLATPEAEICYGRSYEENHHHNPVSYTGPMRGTGQAFTSLFPLLLRERWWTTSSPIYRHSLCRRIGPWLPLINEEDWEYDARAAAHGARLVNVAQDVSVRRIGLSSEQLSLQADHNPQKLRDKATARLAIHNHALACGYGEQGPEMLHFYRMAIVLSRQCAQVGLIKEAEALYALVQEHASLPIQQDRSFRWYGRLARLLGWRRAAKLVHRLSQLKRPMHRRA